MSVTHLSTEEFKTKVFDYTKEKDWSFSGNKPAIIDFYADWCGPCQMMRPIFEELSKDYAGKIKFAKLNTEDAPDLAQQYFVQGI